MIGERMNGDDNRGQGLGEFDPALLRDYLDAPYGEIRAQARTIFARPGFELADELNRTAYRELVLKWAKELAEEGETRRGYPMEYGGQGEPGAAVASFETLALGDLSLLVKIGVQFGLFGGAVQHLGTRHHHETYLADIGTLALPGCFAMTESGHGSDVQSLQTTATYDGAREEFVITTPDESARKDYIGNAAAHGRMAAVFAKLIVAGEDHGVHALLVPIRSAKGKPLPGVRITDCGHKLGLNGVDNGRLYFDNVRVPRTALLDRYGSVGSDGTYRSPIENPTRRFFTMVGTLIQGRVSVSGAGISAAKVGLTIALRHAANRTQFNRPGDGGEVVLLDYLAQQRRLIPLLATTYALHFAQGELVAQFDQAFRAADGEYPEQARRELESRAAGLKAFATWHATETIQTCREACGGVGYLAESRIAALKADTDVFTTFEGDNTVLLQLVGKSLLTGYREEFGELNPVGIAAFVASQAIERLIERTAARELFGRIWDDITPRSEEETRLETRQYQLALFAWRAEHMLSSVARRIKGGVDAGHDPFEVFIACQDHVLGAARAHVEQFILEAFARGVSGGPDDSVRDPLNLLCDLYFMSRLEADRAWFQEHGRISSTRSKAVIRSVNRLCRDLRPRVEELTDALAVPDSVLPKLAHRAG